MTRFIEDTLYVIALAFIVVVFAVALSSAIHLLVHDDVFKLYVTCIGCSIMLVLAILYVAKYREKYHKKENKAKPDLFSINDVPLT